MIFSDKEIVSMLRAEKKEQAFNALVQEYKERLYWHIRRFTCSHEDADDLLQETFIKIWGALDSFKGASSLFTWVYKIATNEALNFLRKKKVRSILQMESLENVLWKKNR